MQIEKLFNGIAVIVDNEIEDKESDIYKIKKLIEAKNIPVAAFDEIPSLEVVPSFSNASFIVLDWDFTNGELEVESNERVVVSGELALANEDRLIAFITCLLRDIFVPIFIFTAKSKESIIDRLITASLWNEEKANRIFVEQKTEIDSDEKLFSAIEKWVKAMPSVYVLKEWARVIRETQNQMFNEMYSYSPNWTKVIWDMLKLDSRDNQKEFGDFVTRQLTNRISEFTFEEEHICTEDPVTPEELMNVVEGERYIEYSQPPSQAYTGDLFYDETNKTYYLNVRAQCDLSRNKNPELYLIKGRVLSDEDIVMQDIRLTNDGILHVSAKERYSLSELGEICQKNDELIKINNLFKSYKNYAFFSNGNIIGKKSEIIIACVAGKKALKFRLDIDKVIKYNQFKEKLTGRILPPYITQIQQCCANYIVREGVTPTPKEIFHCINL